MKTVALLLALSVTLLSAGPVTQGERDYALSGLHASRKMFLDSIAGLSPAQWNFKPAANRWSIAEAAEHIILTEDEMRNWEKQTLANAAVTPDPNLARKDHELYRKVIDRSEGHREQAPKSLVPSGRFATPQAAAEAFESRRDETLDYMRTTQDDLRSHVAGTGENALDVYQMVLTTAAHTERHVAQIDEVKADPKYPKQ